jgi:hypothetical protein
LSGKFGRLRRTKDRNKGQKKGRKKLVLAAGMQNREDHQVGIREEPLLSADAGGFRGASEFSKVLVMGEGAQVIEANPSEAGYFVLGERLLARLDANHLAAS